MGINRKWPSIRCQNATSSGVGQLGNGQIEQAEMQPALVCHS